MPDPQPSGRAGALGSPASTAISAGLDCPSPVDRVVSATRLERWATCPFAYLVGDVLGVEEVENPEDELKITPLERGSLVHEVLDVFVNEVLARPTDEQPEPSEPWSDRDRARLVAIARRHVRRIRGSRRDRTAGLLAKGQAEDHR